MPPYPYDVVHGLRVLRVAVRHAMMAMATGPEPAYAVMAGGDHDFSSDAAGDRGAHPSTDRLTDLHGTADPSGPDDGDQAVSTEESEEERTRMIALVELARKGDTEAFGALYDHYHRAVYRFLFYRTRSVTLAEDLTSETFFRALRSMTGFRWQGKDFVAWLMTIARNLATDHFKAGRTRLEMATEDMGQHDDATDGPESIVMSQVTNSLLLESLAELPAEQRDCIVLRFLQGMSIAETAAVLDRSDGAVKQLQLRGIRNLAKLVPDGLRE
ncbi:MAG: sigma-70 family RNA polymerase sigma factor [Nocardioides sp.]|uniref:sigma-70 family RNA polymerase sigma factor n=1 Tax=Nocardioides sp. TaxID=35761 RepID=UPI0039E4D160